MAQIKLNWTLFKRLWAAVEVVAEQARVFIEWPCPCASWKQERVAKFLM